MCHSTSVPLPGFIQTQPESITGKRRIYCTEVPAAILTVKQMTDTVLMLVLVFFCDCLQRGTTLYHDHTPGPVERSCPVFPAEYCPLSNRRGKTHNYVWTLNNTNNNKNLELHTVNGQIIKEPVTYELISVTQQYNTWRHRWLLMSFQLHWKSLQFFIKK